MPPVGRKFLTFYIVEISFFYILCSKLFLKCACDANINVGVACGQLSYLLVYLLCIDER